MAFPFFQRKTITPSQTKEKKEKNTQKLSFVDNRSNSSEISDLQSSIDNSDNSQSITQLQEKVDNKTGMPDDLKKGVENLSGEDMSDVKVTYNSDKPAQLQAHAYAVGNNIHIAPGQEKQLPHEAWHVVQQKQNRVKPTTKSNSGAMINEDPVLENEADVMGQKALQNKSLNTNLTDVTLTTAQLSSKPNTTAIIQKAGKKYKKLEDPEVTFHKAMGSQLIDAYRMMDNVAEAMQKGKNKTAMIDIALGFAEAGFSIALLLSGVPDLFDGSDLLSGDLGQIGAESLGKEAVDKGGNTALGAAKDETVNPDIQGAIQKTTTLEDVVKAKIYAKVGTINNTCDTLLGMIPFFSAIKSVGKGVKEASLSKDQWNAKKGVLLRHIRDIEVVLSEAISEIDVDNYGGTEIISSNKKTVIFKTKRTLNEVLSRYQEKSSNLRDVTDAWIEKHIESVPLLTKGID